MTGQTQWDLYGHYGGSSSAGPVVGLVLYHV